MNNGVTLCIVFLAFTVYLVYQWINLPSDGVKSVPEASYDFIIVGAGTSGSVLAARLSEVEKFKVLLVEAGGEESWMSRVPLITSYLQTTDMAWPYKTMPQKHAMYGLINNEAMCPRGKGFGGSSSINNMVHMFGVPEDYDSWQRDYNASGWTFGHLKSYIKKSEHVLYGADGCPNREDDRGCYGPLKVSQNEEVNKLSSILLEAASSLQCEGCQKISGLSREEISDWNGFGLMKTESNVFKGMRYGTAQAYLRPSLTRPNLHVLINSKVHQILFTGDKAIGIRLQAKDGTFHEPKVRKEILVSAGSISTPQLLMLSGVGNATKLQRLGIKIVKDLPDVGSNLNDQLALPIYFHLEEDLSLNPNKLKSMWQALKYIITQKGYFSWTGIEVVGRITMKSTKNSTTSLKPQMLLMILNIGSVDKELYSKISNMKMEAFEATFPGSDNETKQGFILLSVCLHPKSKGFVDIVSSDPNLPPVIDPRYLSEEHDVSCLAQGYKFASQLEKSDEMRKIGAKVHIPSHKECRRYPKNLESKEYLKCLVRMTAITAYHPLGTCAMPSVVDSNLRIKGLRRIRIVDGSVLPSQVSGTPHASIVAVAEKASDIIKETHGIMNL